MRLKSQIENAGGRGCGERSRGDEGLKLPIEDAG